MGRTTKARKSASSLLLLCLLCLAFGLFAKHLLSLVAGGLLLLLLDRLALAGGFFFALLRSLARRRLLWFHRRDLRCGEEFLGIALIVLRVPAVQLPGLGQCLHPQWSRCLLGTIHHTNDVVSRRSSLLNPETLATLDKLSIRPQDWFEFLVITFRNVWGALLLHLRVFEGFLDDGNDLLRSLLPLLLGRGRPWRSSTLLRGRRCFRSSLAVRLLSLLVELLCLWVFFWCCLRGSLG
mmetsp:Transcript_19594/g.45556  ORF Transcript_19594/g.45556 Transcript_19594/m.45556 type:complete len:237 (+) Transcript_19594:167-877(+)